MEINRNKIERRSGFGARWRIFCAPGLSLPPSELLPFPLRPFSNWNATLYTGGRGWMPNRDGISRRQARVKPILVFPRHIFELSASVSFKLQTGLWGTSLKSVWPETRASLDRRFKFDTREYKSTLHFTILRNKMNFLKRRKNWMNCKHFASRSRYPAFTRISFSALSTAPLVKANRRCKQKPRE